MNPTTIREPPTEMAGSNGRRLRTLTGAVIGAAVGDSIGLPMEGLSRPMQQRFFPGPLRQRLIGPYGMISDDTEHTIMVAQSLLEHPNEPILFQRSLARRFRWWLASLPAGVGFATLRSIAKLWLGIPPDRSGVRSAGNGPAMRSAIIGAYFADDETRRREFTDASTRITHHDPRAQVAALAVAETAAWAANVEANFNVLYERLLELDSTSEWQSLIRKVQFALQADQPVPDLAAQIGGETGVSGYAFQTVPVAIYASVKHRNDFRSALTDAIRCGGDTDTVAAITGALVGCHLGLDGIPSEWISHLIDWPRSIGLMQSISERLNQQFGQPTPLGPVSYCWPAIPLRNAMFLGVVLLHGFRRLLPPY